MARLRSPGYPDVGLPHAIELASKMYASNRTYPMDREVAAMEMGFSGLTGPSSKRLASLIQFGLLEKHAKNEVRVSALAESILHPDSTAEKEDGVLAAAFNPQLFRELQERFPAGVPSRSNLESYLLKSGFSDRGVKRAINAYLATCEYVERYIADESQSDNVQDGIKYENYQEVEGDQQRESPIHGRPHTPYGRPVQREEPSQNAINLSVSGGLVRTHEMILDADGLKKLKRKIDALLSLVEDEDVGPNADESLGNGGNAKEAEEVTEVST